MSSVADRLSEVTKERIRAGFEKSHKRAMSEADFAGLSIDRARLYLSEADTTATIPSRKVKKRHIAGLIVAGFLVVGALSGDTPAVDATKPAAEVKATTAPATTVPAESAPATTQEVVAPTPTPATTPAPAQPTYVAPVATPTPAPAAPAVASSCHPNYSPCIPIAGDLNCPDVGMQVRVIGADPYRLDADDDGTGCDSY